MCHALAAEPIKPYKTVSNGVRDTNPSVLANIYESQFNIAIWQRELPLALQGVLERFVETYPTFQTSMTFDANNALPSLIEVLKSKEPTNLLAEDLAQIIDMFCCLFEQNRVGLRLTVLSKAMCPKFHVDQVPCRLVSTYHGDATEWLPNVGVDRAKLGHGSDGLADHESGLYLHQNDIQQLNKGDVALLKGERWEGNESAGLIHRSPGLQQDKKRLLLTLDFSG